MPITEVTVQDLLNLSEICTHDSNEPIRIIAAATIQALDKMKLDEETKIPARYKGLLAAYHALSSSRPANA